MFCLFHCIKTNDIFYYVLRGVQHCKCKYREAAPNFGDRDGHVS